MQSVSVQRCVVRKLCHKERGVALGVGGHFAAKATNFFAKRKWYHPHMLWHGRQEGLHERCEEISYEGKKGGSLVACKA